MYQLPDKALFTCCCRFSLRTHSCSYPIGFGISRAQMFDWIRISTYWLAHFVNPDVESMTFWGELRFTVALKLRVFFRFRNWTFTLIKAPDPAEEKAAACHHHHHASHQEWGYAVCLLLHQTCSSCIKVEVWLTIIPQGFGRFDCLFIFLWVFLCVFFI